jgi:hypothetical protein
MPWRNSSLNAGGVMADASLNRRQTIRAGAGVAFAQIGIVGFDGQIELEALRLFGLSRRRLLRAILLQAAPRIPTPPLANPNASLGHTDEWQRCFETPRHAPHKAH